MSSLADLFPKYPEHVVGTVLLIAALCVFTLILLGIIRLRNRAFRARVAELLKAESAAATAHGNRFASENLQRLESLVEQVRTDQQRGAVFSNLSGLMYFVLGVAAPILLKTYFGVD